MGILKKKKMKIGIDVSNLNNDKSLLTVYNRDKLINKHVIINSETNVFKIIQEIQDDYNKRW